MFDELGRSILTAIEEVDMNTIQTMLYETVTCYIYQCWVFLEVY